MNILHFLSDFSRLSESFIYDEVLALEKLAGHANTVLACERHLEKERPFPRVALLRKSPSVTQNFHRRCLKHFKSIRVDRQAFPLYSYLDRHLDSFDILQAHFGWNAVRLWHALKLLGCERLKPVIVRCRGTDINSRPILNPEYKRQLLEMAASDNVLLTANSEFMEQKMIRLGIAPAKIQRVANTFNSSFLEQRKRQFFKPGDCLKLVNTARFTGCKGQNHLVKGFAKFVRNVYPNSVLTLIGDGETLDHVKQLAAAEGVAGKVNFLGAVPHPGIARHLSESDLYLQPSIIDPKTFQEEGLPVAVLEALAVGLPLIVTRTGGMPEIVGTDNTFARIVPDQDPEAIFRALKDLFEAGTCFQDTSAYSQKRLAAFTRTRQLEDLASAYSKALHNCQLAAAA